MLICLILLGWCCRLMYCLCMWVGCLVMICVCGFGRLGLMCCGKIVLCRFFVWFRYLWWLCCLMWCGCVDVVLLVIVLVRLVCGVLWG